ncbi:MAG: cobalt-precorrin-5B (C(1))-methyltransferase CbiD, partial [Lachnospiraceae bacterium]
KIEPETVRCAIRKDSGDDPDITSGILIYGKVSKCRQPGIHLAGGQGVGTITKRGLSVAVGEAAINPVPRQMIQKEAETICAAHGYEEGLEIVISIPQGEELADKTFNPRLGIEGGLSVLGTTGIVEPMSERALLDTIFLELRVRKESGAKYCYIVPGNYGSDFLQQSLHYDVEKAVKCSNYIGETIDFARQLGFEGILLVGHVGKMVKLAAGIMNTHSRQADGRMEIFAAHAALLGATQERIRAIMEAVTTTEVIAILSEAGLLEKVMESIMKKINTYVTYRAGNTLHIGVILFSEEQILGKTEAASQLQNILEQEKEMV